MHPLPMEAAGAVDAKNAPTAPCKTHRTRFPQLPQAPRKVLRMSWRQTVADVLTPSTKAVPYVPVMMRGCGDAFVRRARLQPCRWWCAQPGTAKAVPYVRGESYVASRTWRVVRGDVVRGDVVLGDAFVATRSNVGHGFSRAAGTQARSLLPFA